MTWRLFGGRANRLDDALATKSRSTDSDRHDPSHSGCHQGLVDSDADRFTVWRLVDRHHTGLRLALTSLKQRFYNDPRHSYPAGAGRVQILPLSTHANVGFVHAPRPADGYLEVGAAEGIQNDHPKFDPSESCRSDFLEVPMAPLKSGPSAALVFCRPGGGGTAWPEPATSSAPSRAREAERHGANAGGLRDQVRHPSTTTLPGGCSHFYARIPLPWSI